MRAPIASVVEPLLVSIGVAVVERARRIIASRPAAGWENQLDFWRTEPMSELVPALDVQLQPQVRTRWFALDVRVALMDSVFEQSALVDSRLQPSRVVARRWGE